MAATGWQVGRYMIMPDHIHLMVVPEGVEHPSLRQWVAYWKSLSARDWPDRMIGKVWQRDFWDTQLRRGEIFSEKWNYIALNPVRARLVKNAADWPFQGELNELSWIGE